MKVCKSHGESVQLFPYFEHNRRSTKIQNSSEILLPLFVYQNCGRFERSDLSAHAMYYIVSAYHEGTGDRFRLSYLVSPLYDELEEVVKAGEITDREARARVIGSIRWDMPSSIETD